MKSFFGKLSARFPFFANRPSALEHAVRQSPKSRRLRMEPLENRALLAVDAFGGAASLIDSDVGENWGPDPAPAAFSAYVLATDAAIVDVSGVNATLDVASFSVQAETPEPVAPPSFDQLMESLGMIEIESLDDESDVASASYLDEAASTTQLLNSLNLQDISQGEPRQVVFYDSSAADFDESTLNLDDESVYYVDAANANDDGAESYSATPRSGGNSSDSGGSGGSSNSGGSGGSSNSGGSGVSGGGDNSAPFLSGGADKAGYVDLVFSADDANNPNKAFTTSVSSWFICSGSAPTYTVDVPQELTCVNVSFNAETSALSVAPSGDVGKGTFTVTAQNAAGSCSVAVNVYSGRVVGYELEERVWGGDWAGVEDSGTAESGVGWNLLWRENEYRWKPVFENGIEPDVVQVRQVVVSAKPTNATYPSSFANGVYNYQGSSGGGTATPEPAPESWPYAIGEPSVNGESEVAMSATLSGVNLSDNSRYCVAASNNVTLTQQNTPETAADRPRVAITEVQSVTWEEPTDTSRPTRLQDDPQDSGTAQRFFPEQLSPTSNVVANQIEATVTLAAPIPTGMYGKVALNWFDPANPIGSQTAIPVIDGQTKQAAGKRDNNGAATFSTTELTFNQSLGTLKQSAALTVTQANAGDNYVVAAHPNASGLVTYRIVDAGTEATQTSTMKYVANVGANATTVLPQNLQTPKLTVWRTLWVERDQLKLAPNNIIQAGIPSIGGVVTSELARACIDVRDYTLNQTNWTSGPEFLPRNFEAVHEINEQSMDLPNDTEVIDCIPLTTSNLWTAHIIGAFRQLPEDQNQEPSSPSSETYVCLGVHYSPARTIVIYNYSISAATNFIPEKTQKLQERTLLHELGHYFGLADLTGSAEGSIMKTNMEPELHLLYDNFTVAQLRKIQAIITPDTVLSTE